MGWARLAVAVVARAVLFSILGMLVWALLPGVIGWTPTTVMTGSMEPRIHPGDVVVARPVPAGSATPSQILLVDDPDHPGRLRLHRFAELAPDGNLILRGDANAANDSTPVAPSAVHGVAALRIPFVGLPVVWFAEKNWGPLAAVLAAVAGLTGAATGSAFTSAFTAAPGRAGPRQREKLRSTARRPSARGARTAQTFLAVAAIPGLVCAALMTASPAHAAFSAAAPAQTSSFSALGSYPCLSPARPDNPYLFYAFNEVSGTVIADTSGSTPTSPHDGTLQGAANRVPGSCTLNAGPALTLDGFTGYVSTATPVPAPDVFTVEIWFKTTTNTGGRLIGLGDRQTGPSAISDRHLFMTDSGAIAFGAAPNPGNSNNYKPVTIASSPGYNNGTWHHAAATMSTAGITLYIDGALAARDSSATKGASYVGYWRVGYDAMNLVSDPTPTSRFFAGTIDNAAVYPTALDATRIQAHFAASH